MASAPTRALDVPGSGVGAATSRRLRVSGVGKRFGRRDPVLEDIQLELAAGTVACIAGRNGAGKTTLLRIVAGLLSPDRGTVSLDGLDPDGDRREYQRHLGFLSAGNGGLYARLSVRAHLDFWARLTLIPPAYREAAKKRASERFSLDELLGQRTDRISMGQRQRVRLAMTFLHQPRLVLLDEPTTSLDEDGIRLLTGAISDVTDAGGITLWASPAVADVLPEVDEAYSIVGGRLERA
jgi:heme ABC exporter ATP-binding subunit CcmA